ncbi:MAG: small GTP-binding protein [Cellvibrionaceae bacterium]|jgi:small GTP-binding protein
MKTVQKKICLLGDFSVGKTSLVRQYVEGRFDDSYLSTIGVKISKKTIDITHEDAVVKLLIWDLAGGDGYSKVTSGYLTGAAGILMVCDVTRKSTLAMLDIYSKQLEKVNKKEIPVVILINKIDLIEKREISDQSIINIAERLDAEWLFTSAKTGEGTENGFSLLASKTLETI